MTQVKNAFFNFFVFFVFDSFLHGLFFVAIFVHVQKVRLLGFFDAGNVYGVSDNVDFALMRTSVGAGISWVSPVGPLRFAVAEPMNKFRGDRIQKLQFQIGTSF